MLDPQVLSEKLIKGDISSLARAITLVESQRREDWEIGKKLLSLVQKKAIPKKRLGFSGPPGVGKSSLIEKLGLELLEDPKPKVAVLAIDPSSEISGGSILGDKTRMEELSRHERAFVRPSANR
ncbi:MAG: methylmalonyl Co-A mutase-associated GTPase MeaB, partial [Pseudomonadota bacterium]